MIEGRCLWHETQHPFPIILVPYPLLNIIVARF
jgi:hypothetical protein